MRLSVIIAMFNAAEFISGCLRSAFSHIPDGTEFIIVDDGSTDRSVTITEKVISEYGVANARIIHHGSNLGLPEARKTGIAAASGEYVIFLDADDTVEPGAYEKMLSAAEGSEADLLICHYDKVINGQHKAAFFKDEGIEPGIRMLRKAILIKISPYLFNKMVRKDILQAIQLPPENIAEDWACTVQYSLAVKNVKIIDEVLYHYNIRPDSLSHNSSSEEALLARAKSEAENVKFIENLLHQVQPGEDFSKELDARKSNVKRILFPLARFGRCHDIWMKSFPEINIRILFNRYIGIKYKIKHIFALLGIL